MLEMLKNGGVRNKIADFGQKSKLSVFVPQILMSLRRLQMWQEKKEIARLMPPLRFAQQMRSTNLLMRMEEPHLDRSHLCFFLNPTKTFSASIVDVIFIRDNDFSSAVFFVNLLVQLTKNAVDFIVAVFMLLRYSIC